MLQVESLFITRQACEQDNQQLLSDLGPVQLMSLPAVTPGSSNCKHLCGFLTVLICINCASS